MKAINQVRLSLALILTGAVCLTLARSAHAGSDSSQTIQVSGTIQEYFLEENNTPNGTSYTALNTLTGSLAGTGVVHIFSSQFSEGAVTDVISKRILFTSEGNLFLGEVGTITGNIVNAVSTVAGGTGIYKNATGQLTLQGVIVGGGVVGNLAVVFTYTGSITLPN